MLFGQKIKKFEIWRVATDSRYLQKLALKCLMTLSLCVHLSQTLVVLPEIHPALLTSYRFLICAFRTTSPLMAVYVVCLSKRSLAVVAEMSHTLTQRDCSKWALRAWRLPLYTFWVTERMVLAVTPWIWFKQGCSELLSQFELLRYARSYSTKMSRVRILTFRALALRQSESKKGLGSPVQKSLDLKILEHKGSGCSGWTTNK